VEGIGLDDVTNLDYAGSYEFNFLFFIFPK